MEIPQVPCACTIAGSDPSGGAGIQSDIRTFSALGVWGLSVVTAVTSQNAQNVRGIWNVPEDAIRLQLATLLEDFDVKAFKTGMLPERGAVAAVVWSVPEDIPSRRGPRDGGIGRTSADGPGRNCRTGRRTYSKGDPCYTKPARGRSAFRKRADQVC